MKSTKVKKEKGITLVTLVITIIVLIVLAGITLSLVVGDNGIITKAKEAKQNMQNATSEEAKLLNELEKEMDEISGGSKYPEDIEKCKDISNLKNSIAFIETVEGQMSEIHSILNELLDRVYIVISGGYNDEEELEKIKEEASNLLESIDYICSEAMFQGKHFLNGSLIGDNAWKTEIDNEIVKIEINALFVKNLGLEGLDVTKEESIKKLQDAVNTIAIERGKIGAKSNEFFVLEKCYEGYCKILNENKDLEITKKNIAKEGIDNIKEILSRILELSKYYDDNNYVDELSVYMIQLDIDELLNSIDIIANNCSVKNQKLLTGEYLNIPNLNSYGLGEDGQRLFVNIDTKENAQIVKEQVNNAINIIDNTIKNLE